MIGRRKFLRGIVAAGGAGLLDVAPRPAAAEPPPETSRLRIAESPAIGSVTVTLCSVVTPVLVPVKV